MKSLLVPNFFSGPLSTVVLETSEPVPEIVGEVPEESLWPDLELGTWSTTEPVPESEPEPVRAKPGTVLVQRFYMTRFPGLSLIASLETAKHA